MPRLFTSIIVHVYQYLICHFYILANTFQISFSTTTIISNIETLTPNKNPNLVAPSILASVHHQPPSSLPHPHSHSRWYYGSITYHMICQKKSLHNNLDHTILRKGGWKIISFQITNIKISFKSI